MVKNIKRVFAAALAAVIMAVSFALPVSAQGCIASVLDFNDSLSFDEEMELREQLTALAGDIDCNIGLMYVSDLYGETPQDYVQRNINERFGEDSDSVLFLLCDDPEGHHWIQFTGRVEQYNGISADLITELLFEDAENGPLAAGKLYGKLLTEKVSPADSAPVSGSTAPAGKSYMAAIEDVDDIFDSEEEDRLGVLLALAALEAQCNMAIIITEKLEDSPGADSNKYLDEKFGVDSDSLVMTLTTNPDGYDYMTFSNSAYDRFSGQKDAIFSVVYDGLVHGYSSAVESFCGYFGVDIPEKESSSSGSRFLVNISDYDNCLSDSDEEDLLQIMQVTADKIECNVGVVISADLGGKDEVEYTDDFADDSFGYGSDNVVMLLCNDHIHYDWISAYGRGTDLFGGRTDDIFDYVYDGLDSYGYREAVEGFCKALERYGANKGNDFYYDYDDDYEYHYDEEDFENFVVVWIIPIIFALITTCIVTSGITKGYTRKAPVSARVYLNSARKKFITRSDVFVNEYTTSVKISSSSSGGGGRRGGGGGRSRSGRSGGGGRRR